MKETQPKDFIRQIVADDIASGKHGGEVVTRFPPEPNGFLHIGHAKSVWLNFSVAAENGGRTYLRFDDTNPGKESPEFVAAIERDVHWLGFDWEGRLTHASDYFDRLYEAAETLIRKGSAYVDSLTADQIREYRGTLTQSGRNSPYRDRSVAENLDLFRRMRAGEFADGEHVLRARIDMGSPNINMRDPTLYRIRHVAHQHTGDKWCIYPMYDFAHGLSDAFEGITHSLCTLEFEDHRPLYDWFLDELQPPHRPRQIEFSRLNLAYTVTSKRKLNELVTRKIVDGWDDPRMPTLAGMRRRGYPPAAIRDFCTRVGVTKKENLIEMALLETCVRESLDRDAERRMAVLRPLRVVLTNYADDRIELLPAANHPFRNDLGTRDVPFARELYIEQDDFMENPPRKFFRLKPGGEVRLRFAYIIRCDEVIRDQSGQVIELRCTYDEDTRSGSGTSDRKVKGTVHWVSARHALDAEVRLYDRLFDQPEPGLHDDLATCLNPTSLETVTAKIEPSLADTSPGWAGQFERLGYFCRDTGSHSLEDFQRSVELSAEDIQKSFSKLVFNRIVSLRDTWARMESRERLQSA